MFFHKLGTPQSEDKLIFDRPDDKELNLGANVTDDGRYLVLYQSKGTSPNNEIAIKNLEQPDSAILRLIDTADATYAPINNDGSLFWLLTTLDAPNGKVISIDLNHPEREHWKTVIPESKKQAERYLDHRQYVHRELPGRCAEPDRTSQSRWAAD